MHLVKAYETWLCGIEPCNTTDQPLPVATAKWKANCIQRFDILFSTSQQNPLRLHIYDCHTTISGEDVRKYQDVRSLIKVQSIRERRTVF